MKNKRPPHLWLGIAACIVFALLALGAALWKSHVVWEMSKNGTTTTGVVVDSKRGARGGRQSIVQFTDHEGHERKGQDLFFTFAWHDKIGDRVSMTYASTVAKDIIIHRGIWTYLELVLLYCGTLALAVLPKFLLYEKPTV